MNTRSLIGTSKKLSAGLALGRAGVWSRAERNRRPQLPFQSLLLNYSYNSR